MASPLEGVEQGWSSTTRVAIRAALAASLAPSGSIVRFAARAFRVFNASRQKQAAPVALSLVFSRVMLI
ncbi:MAG: hypothetical protein ING59_11795 [Burkholderiales bacterium]|jgi:hypothetical protein|nr:hypothetical protein [Burkholderiales bacterium]